MPRLADHPTRIRPLGGRPGALVMVDKHPICDACGAAVTPTGPDTWRHVPPGRTPPRRSRWLSPVASTGANYTEFRDLYPWATASPDEWRTGRDLLIEYRARLATARRARRLYPGENPYLDLAGFLIDNALPTGVRQMLSLPARRRELAALFSWAIPDATALSVLGELAPIVECGAGTGYWAALLRARGIDLVAYDLIPPASDRRNAFHRRRQWTPVEQASAVEAVRRHRDRTLLLCWPPHDDDAASHAALRAYAGDTVCYIGEASGGATGTIRFHRELELNWHVAEEVALPAWPGLSDRLVTYRRNAAHRPLRARDRCYECGRFIPTGAIGRCDRCFERRPPALALQYGDHRMEYPQSALDAMPSALVLALRRSPHRIA